MSAADHAEHPTDNAIAQADQPVGRSNAGLALGPFRGVLFAVLGVAIAYFVLQPIYPKYELPRELRDLREPTPAQMEAARAAMAKVNRQNAILGMAIVGGLLGISLGIGEGIARRSVLTIVLGSIACAAAGVLFGVLGGYLGEMTNSSIAASEDAVSLVAPLLVQSVTLGVLGLGIGLALGGLVGSLRTAGNGLVAGLLAGGLVGLCFPMLVSYFMPMARSELIVPLGTDSRMLWLALLGLEWASSFLKSASVPDNQQRPCRSSPVVYRCLIGHAVLWAGLLCCG